MPAEGFRWPPAEPGGPERPGPAAPTGVATAPTATRSVWRDLARVWLAPSAAPVDERAAAAGWAPEALGAWCDRCGVSVGPHEENEFGCAACRGSRPPWGRVVRLGEHAGPLRDWVHEVKFARFRTLGVSLGRTLGRRVIEAGGEGSEWLIVPAPTTRRRRLARGVDHAGAIAAGVAAETGWPVRRLLARRHRPSQTSLPASERKRNAAGAFRRRGGAGLAGARVLVVDDVMTTGATASAACRALVKGLKPGERPGTVWVAVVAVAPRPGTSDPDGAPEAG